MAVLVFKYSTYNFGDEDGPWYTVYRNLTLVSNQLRFSRDMSSIVWQTIFEMMPHVDRRHCYSLCWDKTCKIEGPTPVSDLILDDMMRHLEGYEK